MLGRYNGLGIVATAVGAGLQLLTGAEAQRRARKEQEYLQAQAKEMAKAAEAESAWARHMQGEQLATNIRMASVGVAVLACGVIAFKLLRRKR